MHNTTMEYLNYIHEHRMNVEKAWQEVQEKCSDMDFITNESTFEIICNNIKQHDLSKYSEHEFVQYRQYFNPIEGAVKDSELFDKAWKHHYENNPHHWEYWTNKMWGNSSEELIATVEMICDWQAMSYKFGNSAKDYFKENLYRIEMSDWKIKVVNNILDRLYTEMEEPTID